MMCSGRAASLGGKRDHSGPATRTVHHSSNLLEAFQAGSYWHSKVVREILMEKMRNSVDFVFILENSREFPDDLFVQFFLHEDSFPEWKLCCEISNSACLPWDSATPVSVTVSCYSPDTKQIWS